MIIKLPEETIAKIASGETITSLSTIIKEMLENSMDAKSTEIKIYFSKNLSLKIVDNGIGIDESDLELLCSRFCTSKLKIPQDLLSIQTYGFRGEALASISMCSKLSVKSKTFETFYEETKLIKKRRIPFFYGTEFTVTNIFYNNKIRKESFSKNREEIKRIIDLLFYYKLINDVKIHCYLENKLIEAFLFDTKSFEQKCESLGKYFLIENLKYFSDESIFLIFSPCNVHLKKAVIIIFLNDRLISNNTLKLEIVNIYKSILPIDKFPFTFLKINLPQNEVDVNVHPSKKEALFDEILIIKQIRNILKKELLNSEVNVPLKIVKETNPNYDSRSPQKIYQNQSNSLFSKNFSIKRKFKLKSIEKLKNEILEEEKLTLDFKKLVFVGSFNNEGYLQMDDKLISFDVEKLLLEFFNQIFTLEFGDFDQIKVKIPYNSNISDVKKEFLAHYFLINIEKKIICSVPTKFDIHLNDNNLLDFINFVNSIEFEDEFLTFKKIIFFLAELFSKNTKLNTEFFEIIKSKIVLNTKIIDEFKEIVSLSELYKMFERT